MCSPEQRVDRSYVRNDVSLLPNDRQSLNSDQHSLIKFVMKYLRRESLPRTVEISSEKSSTLNVYYIYIYVYIYMYMQREKYFIWQTPANK